MLLVEVGLYIITDFAYTLGMMSKVASQVSFYTAAVCTPFVLGWISFVIPYVIIRKCQKCGSKNISSQHMGMGRVICDDCGHVFKSNNIAKTIITVVIPLSIIGPSFAVGAVLAGKELPEGIIGFGILLSFWLPSSTAEMIYSIIKLKNSAFFKEYQTLAFIFFITSIIAVPILMLMVYWGIIFEILKIIGL